MRKSIGIILVCCIGTAAIGQTLRYGEKGESKIEYLEYVSKDSTIYRIGDTLYLGTPFNNNKKFSSIMRESDYFFGYTKLEKKYSWEYLVVKTIGFNESKNIADASTKSSKSDFFIFVNIEDALNSNEIVGMSHKINNNEKLYSENKIEYFEKISDTISFYKNWDKMYKAKVIGICSGIAAGGFAVAGSRVQVNNAIQYNESNLHNALYGIAGACAVTAIVCIIIDVTETKKIRDKHNRIKFTPNGVVVNLN